MRVLTLTPFYPTAIDDAQGCFIAEPLRATEALGIQNVVFAVQPFYRKTVNPSLAAPKASWVRYLSLPSAWGLSTAGAFLFARLLPMIRRLHRESPIDIIHAHAPLPAGHAARLLSRELKIPFVVSVHGLDAFSTEQVRGVPGGWCERVSRSVYMGADRVLCISNRVREEVEERAPGAKTLVVYNGVDTTMFSPGPEGSDVVILSVGNLIPIKGHDVLIRSFAKAAEKHSTARLEIIGTGPEQNRLAELAGSLGIANRVVFLGRQSRKQVAEAMQRCTIFALPSRYEGLGCVYLEGMASGKPVIACRGQGIEEIIQSGKNGLLGEPGGVEQLAHALRGLLETPSLREQIGAAARQTMLHGFTLADQAQQLVAVYEDCVR